MRRIWLAPLALSLAFGLSAFPRQLTSRAALSPDFVHFETAHVHPACLTPDGARLLVVNTPDGRLGVFDLTGPAPVRVAEIPVGLEPVSVAAPSDSEAWVVNNLSDDVSVVDLATMHVKATLRVGDEPADVVFAGSPLRAYVSVSQEDAVKVYDPGTLAQTDVVPINGRMPTALARNPEGTRVYVSVLHAGNRTSVLSFQEAFGLLPPPNPSMAPGLPPPPNVGLIIQQQGGHWVDESGRNWDAKVPYSLWEVDVAEMDAASPAPGVLRTFGDLGTVNFALAVSPAPGDGRVALTSTEARNLVRFEPNLRGHLVDTRLSLITPAGATSTRLLNPHVNYADTVGTQAERDSAIGIPTGVAWSGDGQRLYVTSLATNRLAVLDPAGGPLTSVVARCATVAGPSGVVVDEPRGRLYVVGRFRNQLQTLSAADFSQVALNAIGFDPTPDAIVNGRKFFYGGFTSAHGDQACATCHLFGDMDNIAWDLGDPRGQYLPPPPGMLDPFLEGFHPMKGPMVTQTLRGLPGTGVLHWRGDRQNLDAFRPAFRNLLGKVPAPADSEMAAFDDFVLPLAYPPNPYQYLDRSMRDAPPGQPSARRGQTFFFNSPVDAGQTCNFCHVASNPPFGPGTSGQLVNDAALQEDQDMKIPQLRNLYRKTGFTDLPGVVNKRGFGYIHDGSTDNLFNFLKFPGFSFGADPDEKRRDLEAFLLSFDTGMAPAVGYQLTFAVAAPGSSTLDTLRARAAAGDCDLIARGRVGGQPRGWLYQPASQDWQPDKTGPANPNLATAELLALAGPGSEVTVTGVPKGSGVRIGIDRDRDGYPDGDELDAGSDPGDPRSTPANVAVLPGGGGRFALLGVRPNPFRERTEVAFTLGRAGRVDLTVYDLLGREVRRVARGLWLEAGRQSLAWDGRRGEGSEAAAGVYFIRLRTDAGHWTRPVVRMR